MKSNIISIIYEILNSFKLLMVFLGCFILLLLNVLGIVFLKYNYNIIIFVKSENKLGIIILLKYWMNFIWK